MKTLRDMLSTLVGRPNRALESEMVARCLRCGASFEKEYRECPKCGGQFVGLIDPPDRDEDAPE